MSKREKVYYGVIFGFVLFIITYIFYLFVERFNLWSTTIGIIVAISIFIIVIIPVTKYLADRIVKFSLDKSMYNKSRLEFLLVILIVIPIVIISVTFYNAYKEHEYSEKNLATILDMKPTDLEYLSFWIQESQGWENRNEEVFEELLDFLSQYEVKKITDSEWESDVSKVTSFSVTIYAENDLVGANIHEDRLSLLGNSQEGYYSILNGPIDIDWIEDFNQKYAPSN